MKRAKNTGFTAVTVLCLAWGTTVSSLLPTVRCAASGYRRHSDDWLDRLLHRGKKVEASAVIAWSYASSRPQLTDGPGEGFYVWHDKNTVHVSVRGGNDDRRRREYRGWVEIRGEGAKLNTLHDEHTEADDEFRQVTDQRILFTLTAGRQPHGFRFNLRGGEQLVLAAQTDGRRTDRVFFGEAMTDARGNPVSFDLKK